MERFELFGFLHILFLASVPCAAGFLVLLSKHFPHRQKVIRYLLAASLAFNELLSFGYKIHQGWLSFPNTLPLHLCDLTIWLTAFSLVSFNRRAFELVYYWGLAGTTMAILTPDPNALSTSVATVQFFLSHGGVVAAILFVAWSGQLLPRPNSFWKAFLILNAYAAVVGVFNWVFDTNYFYLCRKPAEGTLLDYLGPWPWYLLAGEVLALGLFVLLSLPLRKNSNLLPRNSQLPN